MKNSAKDEIKELYEEVKKTLVRAREKGRAREGAREGEEGRSTRLREGRNKEGTVLRTSLPGEHFTLSLSRSCQRYPLPFQSYTD